MNIIYLLILFSFVLSSCGSESKSATEETKKKGIKTEVSEVKTTLALQKTFDLLIHTTGKIEAEKQTEMRFLQSGILHKVYAMNGKRVAQNEKIAEIDKTEWLLQKQKAEAQVAQRYEEYKGLFVDFGGTWGKPNSIADTLNKALMIRSGLQMAQIALQEINFRLQCTELKAPFDGVVADLKTKEGNLISTNDVFCIVYTPSHLSVVVEVLQHEALRIRRGQETEVRFLSDSPKPYKAIITEINPKVSESGLVRIKMELQNTENVMIGMNAQVTIHIPIKERVVVPKEAIVVRSGKEVVFSAENNLAKWNYVKIGLENGKEVEILEGLQPNTEIIITNNLQLAHDSPIKIAKK